MCLRSISGAKKWGRFIRFGATAAPLEPDLVWTDADTGGTKVRDHPKAVGSCASAAMVGISYRDIYDLFLMLRDVIPMLLRTAPTWLWLLAYRRLRYVTGRPSGSVNTTRMDLLECGIFFIYLAGWAPCTYDLYGSVFSLRAWLRFSRRERPAMKKRRAHYGL